jgi:hypothetical protein
MRKLCFRAEASPECLLALISTAAAMNVRSFSTFLDEQAHDVEAASHNPENLSQQKPSTSV